MAGKLFTMEEVAQHNTEQSTWVVIDGKVVDVTAYISEHPGGEEVMRDVAGTDASEAFEDVQHSRDAKEIMEDYVIGSIKEAPPAPKPAEVVPPIASAPSSCNNYFNCQVVQQIVVPTVIGLALFVSYKLVQQFVNNKH